MNKQTVEQASAEFAAPSGTSTWRPHWLDSVPAAAVIPLITAEDARPIIPGVDLWDSWPLQHENGSTAILNGQAWWFFLSAEQFPDPGQRHDAARIRVASFGAEGWTDHGCVIAPERSPGSREWAGSAVLSDDGLSVSLYFTAAGQRGQAHSFEQRLFVVEGSINNGKPGDWGTPQELIAADGQRYVVAREADGRPGMIKAFRDPAWFRDPATGQGHVLFTASAGWTDCDYNGLVGIAALVDGTWQLGDPLIEAVGVNNELERPHIVVRDGRYYLFWSTQRRTFDPAVASGPNGLYAMVAGSLDGPWRPVNGNGLVAANPPEEPTQGYSWWVTGEGVVWSFIDHWGMAGRNFGDHPELLRSQFGGTPAPCFQLAFAGDAVHIVR